MKGKVAFVLGAAVGYVLGSRAGRARYEQIKRGAQAIWETEPVQRGVGVVRESIDDRANDVKAFIRRASSDAFANIARQTAPKPGPATQSEAPPKAEASEADAAKDEKAGS